MGSEQMINMAIVDDDSDFLEELKEISEKYRKNILYHIL